MFSVTATSTADFLGSHFFAFLVASWMLDFTRPKLGHSSYTGLGIDTGSAPRLSDYLHFSYNIVMSMLLSSLVTCTPNPPAPWVVRLILIFMGQGMAIHLVGDSVQSRLVDMGVDTSIPLPEDPLVLACATAVEAVPNHMCDEGAHFADTPVDWCQGPGLHTKMVDIFENMYLFDEYIGHYMWLIMEFICFYFVFHTSFVPAGSEVETPPKYWYVICAPLPTIMFPYLFIESQAWHIFLAFYAVVAARYAFMRLMHGYHLDINGRFLMLWWSISLAVFVVWCSALGVPFACVYKIKLHDVPEYWESSMPTYALFFKPFWRKNGRFFDAVPEGEDPYANCYR